MRTKFFRPSYLSLSLSVLSCVVFAGCDISNDPLRDASDSIESAQSQLKQAGEEFKQSLPAPGELTEDLPGPNPLFNEEAMKEISVDNPMTLPEFRELFGRVNPIQFRGRTIALTGFMKWVVVKDHAIDPTTTMQLVEDPDSNSSFTVLCEVARPWDVATINDTVTVTGELESFDLRLKNAKIVATEGGPTPRLTAQEITQAYVDDPEAAKATYAGKFAIVSGKIVSAEQGRYARFVFLEGTSDIQIAVREFDRSWTVGKEVELMGQVVFDDRYGHKIGLEGLVVVDVGQAEAAEDRIEELRSAPRPQTDEQGQVPPSERSAERLSEPAIGQETDDADLGGSDLSDNP